MILQNKSRKTALILLLLSILSYTCISCTESRRSIVYRTYTTTGTLLIVAHDALNSAHDNGLVDDLKYQEIKVNWERARKLYNDLTPLASLLLESENDISFSQYLDMVNQITIIATDIMSWINEP